MTGPKKEESFYFEKYPHSINFENFAWKYLQSSEVPSDDWSTYFCPISHLYQLIVTGHLLNMRKTNLVHWWDGVTKLLWHLN